MNKYNLSDFTRGWIIGDFEPSIFCTKDFEVMIRHYTAGEKETAHIHKIADEITVIVSGIFKMNNDTLQTGDIIHLSPGDATDFECIESGATTVIKMPSIIGDKYSLN